MKVEIDGSRARSAVRTTVGYLVALLGWLSGRLRSLGAAGAAAGRSLGVTAVRWLTAARRRTAAATRRAVERTGAALGGDTTRGALRTVRHGLVGRRTDVSVLALLLAPVLALTAEWWVVRGVGYRTVEAWVRGTWTGTDPQTTVFLATAALLGLAATSAALNSGLVPTTALVTAPVFGVAFARYGLVVEPYGTVGLVEAAGTGLLIAAAVGVPLAVAGFVVGVACRRAAATLRGGGGGPPSVERV